MAKKILRSDISEDDIFKGIRDSADETIKKLDGINKQFAEMGTNIKTALGKTKFDSTSSINAFMKQTEEANKLTKEQIKLEQELLKATKIQQQANEAKLKSEKAQIQAQKEKISLDEKTLKLMQEESKTEIQQIKLSEAKQKLVDREIKAQKEKLKEQEKLEKQALREAQANSRLESRYARINKMLANMRKEYRDLAIKKELGANLTAKEEMRYKTLGDRIVRFDTALKGVDASMGLHQRNVGNYASGWNGLGNSINQLSRELPAFTNSIQTGFLAISNNLPMLFDEIEKIKKANVDLKASGQPTTSALKQVAGSLFSLQTAFSIGITLLTVYGAKLIDFAINKLSPANKELERQQRLNKAIIEQQKEKSKFVAEESAEFIGNINLLRKSNANSSERAKLIDKINEKYGLTLKNLKDEKQFQNELNKEVGSYLKLQIENYRQKQNEQNIISNLQKQDRLNRTLSVTRKEQLKIEKDIQKLRNQQASASTITTESRIYSDSDRLLMKIGELEEQYKSNSETIKQSEKDLEAAKKRLLTYEIDVNIETDKGTEAKQKNAKAQKELNTEFKDTNEYLSREIELLKELQDIENDRAEQWTENLIERELKAQLRSAEMLFEANVDELERLLDVLTNMKIARLKKDTDFELSEIDRKTKYEIEQNRIKLKEERDELLKGGGDKTKIEANYQNKLKELELEEEKRYRDAELEKKIITEKSAQEVIEIEKDKNAKIEDYNDQVHEALQRNATETNEKTKELSAEELETRKELMNQINDLVKFSTDYFIEQSQRRIEQIDKEIQALEKQSDFLEQLAVNGNITAEKSLAVNKKLQAEAQQEREKELKKQERIKLAQSVYDSYSANVASGQQNPVTKTITDITLLNQFIKSLPTFYEGTETTVGEALGAPNMSGKDGYIVRVDGSEKVLNPELSRMTGNMTTREIAQISEDRLKGRLIYKGEASQIGSAWESQLIVNQLAKIEEVIKNKPETTIQASEIIGGVMHIIEARKEKNTTVRNIRRIK